MTPDEVRLELLLTKAMISCSSDSHILWDKKRMGYKVYPTAETEHISFYNHIINNTIESAMEFTSIEYEKKGLIIDSTMCDTHNRLFDLVDASPEKTYTSIIRIAVKDVEPIVLEVTMKRFNHDKYYEVVRNITTFARSREALMKLGDVIREFAAINHEKMEFLHGR